MEEKKQKIASLRNLIEQKMFESCKQQRTLDITGPPSLAQPSLFNNLVECTI
jgi:hypothetical protein